MLFAEGGFITAKFAAAPLGLSLGKSTDDGSAVIVSLVEGGRAASEPHARTASPARSGSANCEHQSTKLRSL